MAVIVVEFQDILGESTVAGFAEKVDAVAVRETIEVAAPQGAGRARGARTVGQAKHSDIELTRYKDRASPKLAQACSSGQNIGDVRINYFRSLESGLVVYMTYTLNEVFVSRVEHDTLDSEGVAFQPHFVGTSNTQLPSSLGLASVVGAVGRSQMASMRLASRPAIGALRGAAVNQEVERVWLNASRISWTYTPYTQGRKGGAIQKGWNIQRGAQL